MRERRAQLFTVFGEAGIGKTSLAAELADAVAAEAQVLTGRCLSYGEGITYWPVREIVAQATGGRNVRELLGDDPDTDAIAERLDSAVGTGTSGAVGEEVFWAVRKLTEALAQDRPLVLVFEDVHWGEPTLLDLIEHLADWVRSAPVLIVCLARPSCSTGAGLGRRKAQCDLHPARAALPGRVVGAHRCTCGGNGGLAADEPPHTEAAEGTRSSSSRCSPCSPKAAIPPASLSVPPAIQALLAARLDHLTPEERRVIERASVEGELFHLDGSSRWLPPDTRSGGIAANQPRRKELIRPEHPTLPGQEAFGFRHALIRDAAYASLPKEARSDLHERYAAWLERALGDGVVEGEEFLAYHLEQAHGYRAELGMVDQETAALAVRAGELFASAAGRAFMRGDWPATVNLYERALALCRRRARSGAGSCRTSRWRCVRWAAWSVPIGSPRRR